MYFSINIDTSLYEVDDLQGLHMSSYIGFWKFMVGCFMCYSIENFHNVYVYTSEIACFKVQTHWTHLVLLYAPIQYDLYDKSFN